MKIDVTEEMVDAGLRRAKRFPNPNKFTDGDMPTEEMLGAAYVGEFCFCIACGEDWRGLEGVGPAEFDVEIRYRGRGLKFDIKNLDAEHKQYLIWSRKKGLAELERRDVFGLALTRFVPGESQCEVIGYVNVWRFIVECRIRGEEKDGYLAFAAPGLWSGTPYMHMDELTKIEKLRQQLGVVRLPFRNNHLCHCGKPGTRAHGFGPISELEWFCAEHDRS